MCGRPVRAGGRWAEQGDLRVGVRRRPAVAEVTLVWLLGRSTSLERVRPRAAWSGWHLQVH